MYSSEHKSTVLKNIRYFYVKLIAEFIFQSARIKIISTLVMSISASRSTLHESLPQMPVIVADLMEVIS